MFCKYHLQTICWSNLGELELSPVFKHYMLRGQVHFIVSHLIEFFKKLG